MWTLNSIIEWGTSATSRPNSIGTSLRSLSALLSLFLRNALMTNASRCDISLTNFPPLAILMRIFQSTITNVLSVAGRQRRALASDQK